MSNWIKCDKCNKITQADSSGEKRYKIGVDGFDGYSTFHVCEWCLRSFYLDYLGWIWNDDEKQYVPQERTMAIKALQILEQVEQIINDTEEIVNDSGESTYTQKCAMLRAYEEIVELIGGKG